MTVFFCPNTTFFYDDELNSVIPEGALEYSAEERDALLALVSHGRRIVAGTDGYPVLIDPPPLTPEQLAEVERYWRGVQLTVTDGMVNRHRDQLEEDSETTLTAAQYTELQAYRRALRDWPQTGEFPLIDHRPPPPLWLAEQAQ
ncbi:hypothetical protein D3C77_325310 [compost metagenome]